MLRLFRASGYRLTRKFDQGVYEVEFPHRVLARGP